MDMEPLHAESADGTGYRLYPYLPLGGGIVYPAEWYRGGLEYHAHHREGAHS